MDLTTDIWDIATALSSNVTLIGTGNPDEEEEDEPWPLYVQVVAGILVTIVCAVCVIGNCCTLIAIYKDVKLRTVHNMYIANLAITDLTIGLCSMPFYGVFTVNNWTWPFNYTFCKVWSVIDFWVCAESALTIILISYDRYLLVSQGIDYIQKQTKKKALIKIGITWLLSFLLYGPAIIGYNIWRGYSSVEEGDCDVEFSDDIVYTLITAIIEFLVPFISVIVLNTLVYWHIRKRSKISDALKSQQGENQIRRAKESLRRDKKAAQSLVILVVVFGICWAPYTISVIILALCKDWCISEDLFEYFNWQLWLNSMLNPFLYAFTVQRFRNNFRKMLCPCIQPNSIQVLDGTVTEHTNT